MVVAVVVWWGLLWWCDGVMWWWLWWFDGVVWWCAGGGVVWLCGVMMMVVAVVMWFSGVV